MSLLINNPAIIEIKEIIIAMNTIILNFNMEDLFSNTNKEKMIRMAVPIILYELILGGKFNQSLIKLILKIDSDSPIICIAIRNIKAKSIAILIAPPIGSPKLRDKI